MSLLVVGSVALDSLETPFGRREDVLGGSASYFSTCASFFGPTRVVAVVGEDFPEEHVRFLHERGIDLAGLARRPGKTFRWKGRYEFDLNTAHTLDTQLNVFAAFRPELPEHYRDSEYVFLGNIDPDLQRAVLDQVKRPRFIGCDTMNYWITSKRESLLETLKRVDMLFVNDAEARQLAGEHNVVKAARKILTFGPRAVVIKRGEYGALFFSGEEVFAANAVPLPAVFDPTGAGDSFAGGFMGYLAKNRREDHATMRRAIVLGSVLASFTVEQFSLDRLRSLTPEEIRARYGEARSLARFDELEADLFNGNGTPRLRAIGPADTIRRRAGPRMRIGIISDIHSNLEALTETLAALERHHPDRIVCLGDVVGYGASVNECCALVRKVSSVTLLGNHDAAVSGRMDYSFYYDAARHALDWTASRIDPDHLEWLRTLSYVHSLEGASFSHGNPLNPEAYEYVFAVEQARELLPSYGALADVSFVGHSHLCKAFALQASGEVHEVIAAKFGLRRGHKYVISVGSVGQPRDCDNRACWVLYDTEERTVEYHRVPYDVETSAQKIFDADLALNFGKRLFLGV